MELVDGTLLKDVRIAAAVTVPVTAGDDVATGYKDKTITINVLANDIDAEGDRMYATGFAGAKNGTVTNGASGSLVYTPKAGFVGTDTFTYKATDGVNYSSNATVTVTVLAPPTTKLDANNDSYQTISYNKLFGNVSDNDFNLGTASVFSLGTTAANGTVEFYDGGYYSYKPKDGFSGTDSFTYKVVSGGVTDTATVTIEVLAQKPVLDNASVGGEVFLQNKFLSLGMNGSGTIGAVTNDAPLMFNTDQHQNTNHVGLAVDLDGFGEGKLSLMKDAILTATPVDTFEVVYKSNNVANRVFNGSATEQIKGNSVNISSADKNMAKFSGESAGKLAVDQVTTMIADTKYIKFEVTLTNNSAVAMEDFHYTRYADPDQSTLSYDKVGGAAFSTDNVILKQGGTDGEALVASYAEKTKTPFFFYTDADNATVATGPFKEYGNAAKDYIYQNPQAVGFKSTGDTFVSLSFGIDKLEPGASTKVTFYLGVTDNLDTTLAQIKAGATPEVNHAPDAIDDAASVVTGKILSGNVLANDKDSDGNKLSASVVTGPKNGTLDLKADGTYTYTAKAGYTGADNFVYKASDGKLSDNATVNLTVTAAPNKAPVAADNKAEAFSGKAVTVRVQGNDSDPDGDPLTASLVSGPKHGKLTLDAFNEGEFTYTPNAGYTGTDSFVYKMSDGKTSSNATVNLTVSALPEGKLVSQQIDDTIFIKNNFLSMAIDGSGTLGGQATYAPPEIFPHYKLGEVRGLGLYADTDGFDSGAVSKMQDTVAMGAPIERFNLGYKIGAATHIEGNMATSTSTITNGVVSKSTDGDTIKAKWSGSTDEKMKVDQTMSLTDDAKFIRVDIILTNQSSETMQDVRYMRSVDTDQDTSYQNIVKIIEQGGDGSNGALLTASMLNGTNPFFYYTADDRAKVSTYNMLSRDPYDTRSYATAQAEGYTATVDAAVNINFVAGTLAAGKSTTLTFYMGVTDNIDATIAQIKALEGTPEPVNRAPDAIDDAASVISGKVLSGNVLSNDKDPDGNVLSASLVTDVRNGTLKLNADGTYTYTAKAGFSGTDSFVYKASDGKLGDNATVNITVNPVPNTAPVAVNDVASVVSGKELAGNVLTNDKDTDGDKLSASLVQGPSNGTLKLNADGSYTYTAKAGFTGSDAFVYKASDGKDSSNATVNITVNPVPNTAPVAVNDAASVVSGKELAGNVLANDTDANGDKLSASLVQGPSNGTLKLNADGSYTYTAKAGFSGSDAFVYKASDGKDSSNATVNITVNPVPNTAPVAVADAAAGITGQAISGNVLTNDTDANGDRLSAALVQGPSNGTLKFNADGTYTYTAKAGFTGTDAFVYKASDGKDSSNATVTLTVNPVPNTAPIAVNDAASVVSGKSVSGNVLTNDNDINGDRLTAALVTGPKNGSLTLNADGTYTYTAKAGYSGTDSFVYKAFDGKEGSNATVTLTVSPVPNVAPVAVNDTATVMSGKTVSGNVLANDSDADGDRLVASVVQGPSNGTLTLTDAGTYTYTAKAGYSGADSFTYKASDGKSSANATVNITVDPVPNAAPVAAADGADVVSGKSVSGNVLANDRDADGDTLSASLVTGPQNGTLTLNTDGSYVYTANAGYTGADSFVYKASDGKESSNATVGLSVFAPMPNVKPVAVKDSATLAKNTAVSGNVLANDSDANGDKMTATLVKGPAHGTLSFNSDGTYHYQADAGYVGRDSFSYRASDGIAVSAATTVALSITNTAPVTTGETINVINGIVATGKLLTNDSDPDGDALTAYLSKKAHYGSVTVAADGTYTYEAKAGYTGPDSFTYKVSDGRTTTVATVSINVDRPPIEKFLDGSAEGKQVLWGDEATANIFRMDTEKNTGHDVIVKFGNDDILLTGAKLFDLNEDGKIYLSRGVLSLDGARAEDGTYPGDTVKMLGVKSLRFLGETEDGDFAYGKANVRPSGAKEGTTADDSFTGDLKDRHTQKYFFDTANGLGKGHDTIANFGAKDKIITTSAILDMSDDGHLLSFATDHSFDLNGQGKVSIKDTHNNDVTSLTLTETLTTSAGATLFVYMADSDAHMTTSGTI